MWEPLVSYAVALIAGAIGGVVGGYFGIAAVNRSHKLSQEAQTERERELSDRVRAMLMIEIEENRQAFERYDAGIDDRVLFMGGKYQPQERAEQLSSIPLPTWKHSYWDALTPSIPNALTVEEIQRCHQFHSGLDELTRSLGACRGRER